MRSRYAMPIAHYIDWLNDMQSIQKRGTGDFHPYAKKIKKLVSGSYTVDARTGEITFKPYQKNAMASQLSGWDCIRLHLR